MVVAPWQDLVGSNEAVVSILAFDDVSFFVESLGYQKPTFPNIVAASAFREFAIPSSKMTRFPRLTLGKLRLLSKLKGALRKGVRLLGANSGRFNGLYESTNLDSKFLGRFHESDPGLGEGRHIFL
jgi:hypothetical protein